MASVTYGSDDDFFAAAFQGGQNATMQVQRTILNMNRDLVNRFAAVGGAALDFVKAGYQKVQEVITANEFRQLKSNMQQSFNAWDKNIVRYVNTLPLMQTAMPVMQHYLMANPVVRQQYHNGILDGYSETYVDHFPDRIGQNHLVYRQVMNGAVVMDEDKAFIRNYYEADEVEKLGISDRITIRMSWEAMNRELDKRDEDPTSIYCASLS